MKNFKILTLAILTCLMGQYAFAQSGFGLRVGALSSDMSVDILDIDGFKINPKAKAGFDIALVYNYDTGTGVSIQPEVHYTQLGFKVDVFGILSPRADFNYIRIPVLIQYDVLSNNENLSLSPFVGPYLGILASDDIDLVSLVANDLPVKSTDVGLDAGIMFRMANGLFFDVRYMRGFQNILDLPIGELRNSSIGGGIGYIF